MNFADPTEKVWDLLLKKTSYDTFNNCHLDVTQLQELSDKAHARAMISLLPRMVNAQDLNDKHMIMLKIAPRQVRLYKYALEAGFVFHQSNSQCSLMTKCLKNHSLQKCSYPSFKTASVGVTAVVFNQTMTDFLAIQEKFGPYRGWKAPTGTVDYEKGEDPIAAAVREVKEETNLQLESEGVLVGNGWTSNFRNTNPDINYVIAFRLDESHQSLIAQESEIREVKWLAIQDFLTSDLPINHTKPLLLKHVVEVAHRALNEKLGWDVQPYHWGSGKECAFFGPRNLSTL